MKRDDFEDIIKEAVEVQEELNKLRYDPYKLPEFISKLRERREWFRKTEQNVRNDPQFTEIEKSILSIMNDLVVSELEIFEHSFELEGEIKSLKDKYEPVT